MTGYWAKGIHLKTEEAGFYRSKDVELQVKTVIKHLSYDKLPTDDGHDSDS